MFDSISYYIIITHFLSFKHISICFHICLRKNVETERAIPKTIWSLFIISFGHDYASLLKEMNALFEQAYQRLVTSNTTPSQELDSLCNDMAQYIPTTTEYTFAFLNSDTYSLALTYAPNQVGTPAFIHDCKQQLAGLTGHPIGMMDIQNQDGTLYIVSLNDGSPMVSVEDVCDIRCGQHINRDRAIAGDIPVYNGREKPLHFTTTEPNRTGKSLVIEYGFVTPQCVRIMDFPFFLTDGAFTLHSKQEDNLLPEYLNQVMVAKQDEIFNMAESTCITVQSLLKMKTFKALKIPLPPLHTQHRIVQELDTIDADIQSIEEHIKCEGRRIQDLQQLKKDVVASMCCVPD